MERWTQVARVMERVFRTLGSPSKELGMRQRIVNSTPLQEWSMSFWQEGNPPKQLFQIHSAKRLVQL